MDDVYFDPSVCRLLRHVRAALMAFAISCFVETFLTDLAYSKTLDTTWETSSNWLLTMGLFVAAAGVLAGIVEFLIGWRAKDLRAVWIRATGEAAALAVAILSAFVHARDGHTAVIPTGITLSAVVLVILLATAGATASRRAQTSNEVR
jgi:uncharacterized membrane protein